MSAERGWNQAFVALGSNIQSQYYLPRAARWVARLGRRAAASTVWRSAPIGFTEQADFFNAVIALETPHAAAPLRRFLRQIENQLGRRRNPANKNAPRTIDLDLILYNDQLLRLERGRIPDPEIEHRPFLARPLAELAPQRKHPCLRATFHELALQTQHLCPKLTACRSLRLLVSGS